MRKLILIVIISLSFAVSANQRTEKIAELMRAQGLLDMWQQQIEMGKVEGQKQAQKMLEQVYSQLNPNEEFRNRFNNAFMSFIEKLQGNWTAQEIVDVWASYYGPRFTDNDLDKLIAFYTSEIGKKDIIVTKEAMVEFSQHFQKENQPILEKALAEYIEEMKMVAKECNCPKKK